MNKQERQKRILAEGETMNHIHCVTGDIKFNASGHIIVSEDSNAVLRHILKMPWIESGETIWTGEHKDIQLTPGIYESVLQKAFDPLTGRIERLKE